MNVRRVNDFRRRKDSRFLNKYQVSTSFPYFFKQLVNIHVVLEQYY